MLRAPYTCRGHFIHVGRTNNIRSYTSPPHNSLRCWCSGNRRHTGGSPPWARGDRRRVPRAGVGLVDRACGPDGQHVVGGVGRTVARLQHTAGTDQRTVVLWWYTLGRQGCMGVQWWRTPHSGPRDSSHNIRLWRRRPRSHNTGILRLRSSNTPDPRMWRLHNIPVHTPPSHNTDYTHHTGNMNRGRLLRSGIGVTPPWQSGRAPRANLQPRVTVIFNRVRSFLF